jgi:hypothetical protein
MKINGYPTKGAVLLILVCLALLPLEGHAWDRSWEFTNPAFNPTSLSGNYIQFTVEANGLGGGDGADGGIPNIDRILDDVFDNLDTLNLDIQEGIGNIGIDLPAIELPEIDIPEVEIPEIDIPDIPEIDVPNVPTTSVSVVQ